MGVEEHKIQIAVQRARQLFRSRARHVSALVHFLEDRDAAPDLARREQLRDPAQHFWRDEQQQVLGQHVGDKIAAARHEAGVQHRVIGETQVRMAAPQRNRTVHTHHRGQVQFGIADIGHRRTAQDQVGDIARGTPDAGEGGQDRREAPAHGATRQPALAIALDAQQRPQHGYGAARASGSSGTGCAGSWSRRGWPADAARWTGIGRWLTKPGFSKAALAVAARLAQGGRVRHTHCSLGGGAPACRRIRNTLRRAW